LKRAGEIVTSGGVLVAPRLLPITSTQLRWRNRRRGGSPLRLPRRTNRVWRGLDVLPSNANL
jgi:hypothetical protein